MDPEEYEYMLGEYLGAFEDDELGARRRPIRSRRSKGLKRFAQQLSPTRYTGSPPRGAREWPLGFPVAGFVAAGPTLIQVVAQPQRVFKGQRLVVDIARTVTTSLVTIDALIVGAVDQRIAPQPLPAAAFAPNAFDVVLDLDPAQPGIDITLQFAVPAALGAGETIDVSAMLIGGSLS